MDKKTSNMMEEFESFLKISFDDYPTPPYLSESNKVRYHDSIIRLMEMYKPLKKAVQIALTTEVPLKLKEALLNLLDQFQDSKKYIDNIKQPSDNFNPTQAFDKIHSDQAIFFEPSSSNKTLIIINSIISYQDLIQDSFFKNHIELNKELELKNKRAEEILRKLENPSAELVLSKYATVYQEEEIRNNKKSLLWLWSAIISTLLFLILTIISILEKWIPEKLRLDNIINGNVGFTEIINIPLLVTKVMLISLIIFFIIFCFKQYSIFKHLAVIHQQKKNAFNSYMLFDAAIGETDTEAKKILLMSLARTIHDSVNSGFLSSKQLEQPLIQNVDLGGLQGLR